MGAADWEYEDGTHGSGLWRPYAPDSAAALTDAYAAGEMSISLNIGGIQYVVDFQKETQTNVATDFHRAVRCNDAPTRESRAATLAAARAPTVLPLTEPAPERAA